MNKFYIILVTIIIILLLILGKKSKEIYKNSYQYNSGLKNMIFTSVGDNTNFYELWKDNTINNYDIYAVYYGNNKNNFEKYKKYVNFILQRKGSKYQNFKYFYDNYQHIIKNYERFFLLDDDIIFYPKDIKKMFAISKKYDLWLCSPTYKDIPECKFFWKITKSQEKNQLRFVNFIENGVVLFNKYALNKFMKFYDNRLLGAFIDYLYIWALTKDVDINIYKNKFALVDSVSCINPYSRSDGTREWDKLNISNQDNIWKQIREKYKINFTDIKPILYSTLKL